MDNKKKIETPEYSVVIPVYNSETSLQELCKRIVAVFIKLGLSYEILFIDDFSSDNSWKLMQALREENENIKILQLMRNYGQHNAIMCGFHSVSGKYIITLDDDLQNPPEEIPKLINKINKGYDAVIGAPESKKDTVFKNAGSSLIRYLTTKIFNKPKELKLSSFRIITRAVVGDIKNFKTPYPFIAGILLSITTNIANVTVKHDERKYGKSNYNLSKLLKLAFNLIVNYSAIPLRLIAFVGMAVSFLALFLGSFFMIRTLIYDSIVPGWTSVVVLLSFFNGILLAFLAMQGEYLARIIGEVSNRKQFIIRKKLV